MNAPIRDKLHPEVQNVLTIFEDLKVPDFYKGTPENARALFRSLRPEPEVLPAIHSCQNLSMTTDGTDIALRLYKPSDAEDLPLLMWFHGGGWVFGDLDAGEVACRELAMQANCAVLSVDYRLAPEARFPTALQDCIDATHWAIENGASLGVDSSRLAVGGDSAGGNLAAAVAQYARDKQIALMYQLLIYPVTQATFDTDSYRQNESGYFLSRDSMIWFWDQYVPDAEKRLDPRVSPLHGNLDGLAPAWLLTCGFDPLCDDGLLYAKAMQQAGVKVDAVNRNDAIHGVFGMLIEPGAIVRRQAAQSLLAAFRGD